MIATTISISTKVKPPFLLSFALSFSFSFFISYILSLLKNYIRQGSRSSSLLSYISNGYIFRAKAVQGSE